MEYLVYFDKDNGGLVPGYGIYQNNELGKSIVAEELRKMKKRGLPDDVTFVLCKLEILETK